MKRILMIITSLLFIICLISCNEEEKVEEINIKFVIEENIYDIKKEVNYIVNIDDIPNINEEDIEGIYYDSNYSCRYNNEQIKEDTVLYVKIKDKEIISKEVENEIKKSYILNFCKSEIGVDDIIIEKYYGNYNGCYVVMIKEINKGDNGCLRDVIIDDIIFKYPFSNREILLWTGEIFLTLDKAYENKYIQRNDILKINVLYNNS